MNTIFMLPFLLLVGARLEPETHDRKVSAAFTHKVQLAQQQDAIAQSPVTKQKKQEAPIQSDEAAWKILSKMNVVRATLTKQEGEGNMIEVQVTESGVASRGMPNMRMIGSSGTVSNHFSTSKSFRNVSVPFEGRVSFRSASSVGMARIAYDREVHFEVTEAGRWLLVIEI